MNNTINIHAQFKGIIAETIEDMIQSGRAATRTEAIRLALLDYRERHLSKSEELDRLAVAKMQRMDKELQEGKRKLISKEKALGKYAKLLK